MRFERIQRRRVMRYRDGSAIHADDDLVVEEPLEIRVNGIPLAVVMRTPGNDVELACGFLFTERIVTERSGITGIAPGVDELGLEARNCIDVHLPGAVDPKEEGWQRAFYASSSCGVCGKSTIASLRANCPPVNGAVRVSTRRLLGLPERLGQAQTVFARTGGLHAAGLFTTTGRLIVLREDVGRHNAVDKVIGWALLKDRVPLSDSVLMVSGRTSFEIVQKAWVGGVPVVAGVSAASSLAVELAQEAGMTLIGFLREGRLSVYCGEDRVV